MRCHYRNVKVTTKVYKPCLSFFISFSFSHLSHSVHHLSFSSLTSSTRRHSQSVHATYETLNSLSIVFYCSHNLYTRRMKPWQTWMVSQLYFIVLTVHTCNIQNHDRLEWLLSRILSFSQSVHMTYKTMTDLNGFSVIFYCSHSPYTQRTKPWQTNASVGLAPTIIISYNWHE